jgi:hypothetical protein
MGKMAFSQTAISEILNPVRVNIAHALSAKSSELTMSVDELLHIGNGEQVAATSQVHRKANAQKRVSVRVLFVLARRRHIREVGVTGSSNGEPHRGEKGVMIGQ